MYDDDDLERRIRRDMSTCEDGVLQPPPSPPIEDPTPVACNLRKRKTVANFSSPSLREKGDHCGSEGESSLAKMTNTSIEKRDVDDRDGILDEGRDGRLGDKNEDMSFCNNGALQPPPLQPIEDPTPVACNLRKRKTVADFSSPPLREKGEHCGSEGEISLAKMTSTSSAKCNIDDREDILHKGRDDQLGDEADADAEGDEIKDEYGNPICPKCSITLMVVAQRRPDANAEEAGIQQRKEEAAVDNNAATSAPRVEGSGDETVGMAALFMSPDKFCAAMGKYKDQQRREDAELASALVPQSPPTAADIVGAMDVPPYCFSCRSYIVFESVEAKKREEMLLNLYDLMAQTDEADDGHYRLPRGKVVVVPVSKGQGMSTPTASVPEAETETLVEDEPYVMLRPEMKTQSSEKASQPQVEKKDFARESFTCASQKCLLDDECLSNASSFSTNDSMEVTLEEIGAKIDKAMADAKANRHQILSSSNTVKKDSAGLSSTSKNDPIKVLQLETEEFSPSSESTEAQDKDSTANIKQKDCLPNKMDATSSTDSNFTTGDEPSPKKTPNNEEQPPDDGGSAKKKRRLAEVSTNPVEVSDISPLRKRLRDSEARANDNELLLAQSKEDVARLEERVQQAEDEKREVEDKLSMALMEKIMAEGQLARAMVGQVAGGEDTAGAMERERAAIEQLRKEHEERVRRLKEEAMEDRVKLVSMGKKMLSDARSKGERMVKETTEAYEARITELVQSINSFEEKREQYEQQAKAKIAAIKHQLHCSNGKQNELSKQCESLKDKCDKLQLMMKRLRDENDRLLCRVPPEQAEAERKVREMEEKYETKVEEIAETVRECKEKQDEYESKARATIATYKHKLHVSTGRMNEMSSENKTLRDRLTILENETNNLKPESDNIHAQNRARFRASDVQRQFNLLQKEFRLLMEDNKRLREQEVAAHGGEGVEDYIKIETTKREENMHPVRSKDATTSLSNSSSIPAESAKHDPIDGVSKPSECRALVVANSPATVKSPHTIMEENKAQVLSPKNGADIDGDELLRIYSVPSFESSPGVAQSEAENLLQTQLNTDVHRQFAMLEQVMEGLLDENRSLQSKPIQSPIASYNPVPLLDKALQEGAVVSYDRFNDLQCKYKKAVQSLKKENTALEFRTEAAVADMHKSEQRAWDLEEELARARTEMALMNLALRRAEMQMGGFLGSSEGRFDFPATDDSSAGVATPKKSENFRSPRRMHPNSARSTYSGRRDDKENRSRRKLLVSSPKPGSVLTPSNRSRSAPLDTMSKNLTPNSSSKRAFTKPKNLNSPDAVEYTTVRMTWKSPRGRGPV